jgi:hypothetical protein
MDQRKVACVVLPLYLGSIYATLGVMRDVGFNAVAGVLALGSLTLLRWARTRGGSVSTSATFLSRP